MKFIFIIAIAMILPWTHAERMGEGSTPWRNKVSTKKSTSAGDFVGACNKLTTSVCPGLRWSSRRRTEIIPNREGSATITVNKKATDCSAFASLIYSKLGLKFGPKQYDITSSNASSAPCLEKVTLDPKLPNSGLQSGDVLVAPNDHLVLVGSLTADPFQIKGMSKADCKTYNYRKMNFKVLQSASHIPRAGVHEATQAGSGITGKLQNIGKKLCAGNKVTTANVLRHRPNKDGCKMTKPAEIKC